MHVEFVVTHFQGDRIRLVEFKFIDVSLPAQVQYIYISLL